MTYDLGVPAHPHKASTKFIFQTGLYAFNATALVVAYHFGSGTPELSADVVNLRGIVSGVH
jgi:hypothetical protein